MLLLLNSKWQTTTEQFNWTCDSIIATSYDLCDVEFSTTWWTRWTLYKTSKARSNLQPTLSSELTVILNKIAGNGYSWRTGSRINTADSYVQVVESILLMGRHDSYSQEKNGVRGNITNNNTLNNINYNNALIVSLRLRRNDIKLGYLISKYGYIKPGLILFYQNILNRLISDVLSVWRMLRLTRLTSIAAESAYSQL